MSKHSALARAATGDLLLPSDARQTRFKSQENEPVSFRRRFNGDATTVTARCSSYQSEEAGNGRKKRNAAAGAPSAWHRRKIMARAVAHQRSLAVYHNIAYRASGHQYKHIKRPTCSLYRISLYL